MLAPLKKASHQNFYIKISQVSQNYISEADQPAITVSNIRHYQTDLFYHFNPEKTQTSSISRLAKNQINLVYPQDDNRDSKNSQKPFSDKIYKMDNIPLRKSKTQEERNKLNTQKQMSQFKRNRKQINLTMKRNLQDKMRRILQKIQEMNDCLNYRKQEKKIILERETASTRSMRNLFSIKDQLH